MVSRIKQNLIRLKKELLNDFNRFGKKFKNTYAVTVDQNGKSQKIDIHLVHQPNNKEPDIICSGTNPGVKVVFNYNQNPTNLDKALTGLFYFLDSSFSKAQREFKRNGIVKEEKGDLKLVYDGDGNIESFATYNGNKWDQVLTNRMIQKNKS